MTKVLYDRKKSLAGLYWKNSFFFSQNELIESSTMIFINNQLVNIEKLRKLQMNSKTRIHETLYYFVNEITASTTNALSTEKLSW